MLCSVVLRCCVLDTWTLKSGTTLLTGYMCCVLYVHCVYVQLPLVAGGRRNNQPVAKIRKEEFA